LTNFEPRRDVSVIALEQIVVRHFVLGESRMQVNFILGSDYLRFKVPDLL